MNREEEIKQIAYDFTTSKGDCKKLENRILSLFGVVKSVCEHSWINTGMTLQGVAFKRCMKCGKKEQTVL
jgi:hypothetical protein